MIDANRRRQPPITFWLITLLLLVWNAAAAYGYGLIFWEKLAQFNAGDISNGKALLPALCYVLAVKAMVSGIGGIALAMMGNHQAKFLFIGPLFPPLLDLSPYSGIAILGPIGWCLPAAGFIIAVGEILLCRHWERRRYIKPEAEET